MKGLRLTEDQLKALLVKNPQMAPSLVDMRDAPKERAKKQKYNNTKVEVDGEKFDSIAEHKRYVYLTYLQKAGQIKNLKRQVPFELLPKQTLSAGGHERAVNYIADFVYTDAQGHQVVEDVKGHATPEYRLKKKLLLWMHGIELREVKA